MLTRIVVFLLLACLCPFLAISYGQDDAATRRGLILPPAVTKIVTLDQNWSHAVANEFYDTAQGSRIVPYKWLVHLEQVGSDKRFLDPAHVWELGYLPRLADDAGNPDGLPVGFVRDAKYPDGADSVGLTCAACHTGLVEHEGVGYLVDGAPALANVELLFKRLEAALRKTQTDDNKFKRFADVVLGPTSPPASRTKLREQLAKIADDRQGYNQRNFPSDGSAGFGHGRVDAFGAILNEVTVRFLKQPTNHRPASAPVSYPFLWDAPQHQKVQWNGAAENSRSIFLQPIFGTADYGALGRNAGEVLGVFGTADLDTEHGFFKAYDSTVNKPNLIWLEDSLKTLWSPQWPTAFPPIDASLRDKGKVLYNANCRNCHDIIQRDDPGRTVNERMVAVGTDPGMAQNFASRQVKTGVLEGRGDFLGDSFGSTASGKDVLTHVVKRVLFGKETQPPAGLVAALEDPFAGLRLAVNAEVETDTVRVFGSFDRVRFTDGRVNALVGRNIRIADDKGVFFLQSPRLAKLPKITSAEGAIASAERWEKLELTASPAGSVVRPLAASTINYQYKARPLNGIWATAPYLHNGSVPNLAELLKPATQRVTKFKVGSRKMDVLAVGFDASQGPFEFDTSLPGNSNAGHEYGTNLNAEQRKHLIEYLKSL